MYVHMHVYVHGRPREGGKGALAPRSGIFFGRIFVSSKVYVYFTSHFSSSFLPIPEKFLRTPCICVLSYAYLFVYPLI